MFNIVRNGRFIGTWYREKEYLWRKWYFDKFWFIFFNL